MLAAPPASSPTPSLYTRLAQRLRSRGIDESEARWTVDSWAQALQGESKRVPLRAKSAPPLRGSNINPIDGAVMVWVPAGAFLMGSTPEEEDAGANEMPQHRVTLDGFWIYKHAVTVAQYHTFCQATHRQLPEAPSWGWLDTHPMVNVCWEDAGAYAEWAHAKLPSEAQWEKAARGKDGRIYPWGNEWDVQKCSTAAGEHSPRMSMPVGSLPAGASPYGCLEMVGNIWQWCADRYGERYYRVSPAGNPPGAMQGTARVVRGGSWFDFTRECLRVARRSKSEPMNSGNDLGFRCVVLPAATD